MDFKSIYSCDPKMNYKIKYNLNVTQMSKNLTEIKGNITNRIPFDDNLTVNSSLISKCLNFVYLFL